MSASNTHPVGVRCVDNATYFFEGVAPTVMFVDTHQPTYLPTYNMSGLKNDEETTTTSTAPPPHLVDGETDIQPQLTSSSTAYSTSAAAV
jgi:hypothetical protein